MVERGDALEMQLGELGGGDLAGGEKVQESHGGLRKEIGHGYGCTLLRGLWAVVGNCG
jgi:hypothetical protein